MTRPTRDPILRYGTAATAVLGLLTAAACTSSGTKPSKSTNSSTSQSSGSSSTAAGTPSQSQLQATLIGGGDIPGDAFKLGNTSPVDQSGAVGIAAEFANADGTRTLSDIIIHFPSPSAAATALAATQGAAGSQVQGNKTDGASAVGINGHIYQGTGTNGPISILVFGEGDYIVTLEFVSKSATDSVPAAIVTQVGQAQDAKVKAAG